VAGSPYRMGGLGSRNEGWTMSKKMPSHHQFMDRFWFNRHGIKHRLAGPAIERSDGAKYWYLHGIIKCTSFGTTGPSRMMFHGFKEEYSRDKT